MDALNTDLQDERDIHAETVDPEEVDNLLSSVASEIPSDYELGGDMWEKLVELCRKYGRDDYASKIRYICVTIDDLTRPEVTLSEIQKKLLEFGDIALEIAIWKDIAKYLNLVIQDEFRKWKAETEEKAINEALRVQFKAKIMDGGKLKQLTNSSVTASDNKVESARMRLYPEKYEYYQRLLNFTSFIYNVLSDLLSVLFKASENHKNVLQTLNKIA